MRWEAGQRVEGLGDAQQWQAPLWPGAGELYRRAGAFAVAPRQSLPALYRYPGKADEPPAGLPSRIFICRFRCCRRSIFRRCRRWVSMSMSMSCLPTPAATTGNIVKDQRSGGCCRASAPVHREGAHCLCFATLPSGRRGLFNDAGAGIARPVARLLGQTGARLYLPAGRAGRYEELDAFVDIAPDNLLHNLQSDILPNCATRRLAGQTQRHSPGREGGGRERRRLASAGAG
ncbi:exodeoxyribonuclease V subunit gamma [Klebsiella pneumoniae]|nr:exodeoxyribonuclease V subunit gamma [Klebsiella pneumoniae]